MASLNKLSFQMNVCIALLKVLLDFTLSCVGSAKRYGHLTAVQSVTSPVERESRFQHPCTPPKPPQGRKIGQLALRPPSQEAPPGNARGPVLGKTGPERLLVLKFHSLVLERMLEGQFPSHELHRRITQLHGLTLAHLSIR